jgi:hypothetical protein
MSVVRKILNEEYSHQKFELIKKYFEGRVFKHTYEDFNAKRRPHTKLDYTVYYKIYSVQPMYDDNYDCFHFRYCFIKPDGTLLNNERKVANFYSHVLYKLYGKLAIKEFRRFGFSRVVRDMLSHKLKAYFNYDGRFLESSSFYYL